MDKIIIKGVAPENLDKQNAVLLAALFSAYASVRGYIIDAVRSESTVHLSYTDIRVKSMGHDERGYPFMQLRNGMNIRVVNADGAIRYCVGSGMDELESTDIFAILNVIEGK